MKYMASVFHDEHRRKEDALTIKLWNHLILI